ncbi:hypothetical protein ABT057_48985, partial [Streptomyces sp. NPDC002588]
MYEEIEAAVPDLAARPVLAAKAMLSLAVPRGPWPVRSHLRDFARRATAALGGRVDILVNNAGIFPVGPTDSLGDEAVEALLATN